MSRIQLNLLRLSPRLAGNQSEKEKNDHYQTRELSLHLCFLLALVLVVSFFQPLEPRIDSVLVSELSQGAR